MNPTKRNLETISGSKVTRELVKNAFDAINLPNPVSVKPKAPVVVGEEALLAAC
jgi:hypothetical protein